MNISESSIIQPNLALCICTYKRPQLLNLLIKDVLTQSILPGVIVIVDGDPASGLVLQLLWEFQFPQKISVNYIRSNHSNLAYQRYLGWLSVSGQDLSCFLYLDDDLRLIKKDGIKKIVMSFTWQSKKVVGITAETKEGDASKMTSSPILVDRKIRRNKQDNWLVRQFGTSKTIPPGGLSPSGNRKEPMHSPEGVSEVEWLQGRVMAFDFRVMRKEVFSANLFALTHIHCGLGEDTYLSRTIGNFGKLLYLHDAGFSHPDDDLPNSYPTQAFKLGYAAAYSRRFLNDNYRPFHSPKLRDRFSLLVSYFGVSLLNWWKAISTFKIHRFTFSLGYSLGVLRGLIQKPTAKNLTPHIDWWSDAEQAITQQEIIQ